MGAPGFPTRELSTAKIPKMSHLWKDRKRIFYMDLLYMDTNV